MRASRPAMLVSDVFFGVAQGDGLEQLVEGDAAASSSSGRESVLSLLADAHGIDDDEVGLWPWRRA